MKRTLSLGAVLSLLALPASGQESYILCLYESTLNLKDMSNSGTSGEFSFVIKKTEQGPVWITNIRGIASCGLGIAEEVFLSEDSIYFYCRAELDSLNIESRVQVSRLTGTFSVEFSANGTPGLIQSGTCRKATAQF